MKSLFGALADAGQTLSGTIFPAGKGAHVTIQVRDGKHWRKAGGRTVSRGGVYRGAPDDRGHVPRRLSGPRRALSVVGPRLEGGAVSSPRTVSVGSGVECPAR